MRMLGHKIGVLNLRSISKNSFIGKLDILSGHYTRSLLVFLVMYLSSPHVMCGAVPVSVKEPQKEISTLMRHEMNNLKTELQILVEKIVNQEDIIESLKGEVELVRKKNQGAQQEAVIKGLASDIKELKSSINQSTIASDERIKLLEKTIAKQNETIEHLRSALGSLVEGIKGSEPADKYTVYEVKLGDSLGVIAKRNKVSVKLIKELNQLKSEIIYKGQKLKIPESL